MLNDFSVGDAIWEVNTYMNISCKAKHSIGESLGKALLRVSSQQTCRSLHIILNWPFVVVVPKESQI